MADLAKIAESLSPKKRELLELLLKEKKKKLEAASQKPAPDRIPRREQLSPAPVSFAQQRLWFIDQLDPGTPAFNIPAAVRLMGVVDIDVLQRCLDEIVKRHETLRTSFASEDGTPVQVIAPSAAFELPVVDLRQYPEPERMKRVQQMITSECQRSFDLTRCPLVRATLVLLGEEDQVLIMMMHHIIGDVWSVRVVMRELAALYEAFAASKPSPLPELPIQYADYAIWLRDWLQGEVLQAQLAYWKEKLNRMPQELELPTDKLRPPVQSIWGAKQFLKIPRELADAMRALGRKEKASLFMTLLAAWKLVLHRYTGQEDIVVGAPVANRNRSEFEGMVGFFVNSLILRTGLSGNPDFREVLRRARETTLGAFSNQDFPFERLVEVLQPARNMSRNPLFQTDFILQNSPRSAYHVTGLSFEPLPVENGTAQLDMTLDLWEEPDGIGGWLEYDTDLFEGSTAARVVNHLKNVLQSIVADPGRPISDLDLLSATERQQLLSEWNDTARPYRLDTTYSEIFEAQVEQTPDSIAVACVDEQVSYRELSLRVRAAARLLAEAGAGPDVVVGLLARRGVGLMTAILAVLETGAAYIPLDPSHPSLRHRNILEQSRTPLIVTSEEFLPVVSEATGPPGTHGTPKVIVLEDAPEPMTDGARPTIRATPDNLAYVIFTSGSTGTPKGVMIHQRGMVNHLWANIEILGMTASDILAQTASQCFDISVWQFLAPLILGGCVRIFPEEVTKDPAKLLREVDRSGVTIFETVPSLLQAGLSEIEESGERARLSMSALRWLLPTGEAVPAALCREWFRDHPRIPLMNAYGPSECSDDVTLQPLYEAPNEEEHSVSIGLPVGNLQVCILDRQLRPVPIGVPGELCVRGIGVGRGYLGLAERTASVFAPDPFSDEPGARLYRSGDRARYLPDARIEFLGRMDYQVKVRGFRIELGEIEAVIGQHEQVAETAVIVREDTPNDARIVAYIVARYGDPPTSAELREHLKLQLPDYMAPSTFVFLDAMPLSPNGKIDRKALPAPDSDGSDATVFIAPRNPTEEVLCSMWCEILGIERIGVENNLFEMGAHSLLVTQVVSRIRKAFKVEPPLRAFFESPTISGIARTIERLLSEAEGLVAPPIVPISREGDLPLSSTQERMWFLDQLEPGLNAYNVPGAVYMDGRLNPISLQEGLSEIQRRHEIFRTTYTSVDGKPVQVIHSPQPFQLPLVDLQGLSEEAREAEALRLARENAGRPFDLARGPVLRCFLVRRGTNKHLLAMTTHHIAYDMWAREIFIFELGTLYQTFAKGESSPLPEPQIQWVDYAHWQRQWLQGEVLEKQIDYWRRKLEGAPPYIDLPIDLPRPSVQSYRGARQYLQLPPELARGIRALSKKRGVTPFITVLSAFKTILYRYTGQEQIVIGSPIANRNRLEVENLMGFVANTLVLYTDLSGNISFAELLDRVRETTLGAHAHQDIPFEHLVQALHAERDMSRSPVFQVMFNYMLSYSSPRVDLADLTLQLERLHSGAAQFEINIDLWETDDGLSGVVEYCTDLFYHTTITRFVTQFRTLLEGIVRAPENRLSEYALLSAAERDQVLVEWNDTTAPYEIEAVYSLLFEAQVERTPDAVAAVCDEEQLSYRGLNQRANLLARVLVEHGAGPEAVVAVLALKGINLMTAIIAVFKAGAAYLPLDPAHPAQRYANIFEQCNARLVLTEQELLPVLEEALSRVEAEDAPEPIVLEQLVQSDREAPNLPVRNAPDNLAYLIFTSGSTGIPKGVLLSQRALVNHNLAVTEQYHLTPDDRVLQFASIGFDVSIEEMLPTWLAGGAVIVERESVLGSMTAFAELIAANELSVLNLPASFWHQWVESLSNSIDGLPACLRLLIVGSERMSADKIAAWQSAGAESVELVNAYGLTESTITATIHGPIDGSHRLAGPSVPIGRPIANTAIYLLNSRLEPAPIGVPAELHLGGEGLARGYLNQPELTAERFVPDPFSDRAGARLYKTGDLARYLSEGTIECVGRMDHQVKVRGFRIELGEIEAALGKLTGVGEAVVLAREYTAGDRRLVGYVASSNGQLPPSSELRELLKQKLPDYMVPTAFVMMETIPRSSNGKIDRKALPAPSDDDRANDADYVEPQTELEREIASVWKEVLGVERVGLNDDFFDVGGHSLLVVQLLTRLRDRLHVEVPIKTFFESSTVAGVARVVTAVRWAAHALESTDGIALGEETGVVMEEGVL